MSVERIPPDYRLIESVIRLAEIAKDAPEDLCHVLCRVIDQLNSPMVRYEEDSTPVWDRELRAKP